jgi:ABC-2 type transport system ATP-binding protein
MSAEVHVTHLIKHYGALTAVNGVSLDVHAGEIFGLLGPNGAGKTTTIECILGLRVPDGGSITIDGIDAIAQPQRIKQIIGAQLQATALQDKLTPREALKFFGAFYRQAIKPSELIERFSLTEKADASFDSLSGGQKQRLALALAFVNNPRIIFLDEPTAGLDAQSRRDLHDDITQLKAEGKTLLLSTHYIEEAQRLCDRIAIINAGKILALGTPSELIARARSSDQVLVNTNPALPLEKLRQLAGAAEVQSVPDGWCVSTNDVSQLVIALVKLIEQQQVNLVDLQIRRPSLEDAFLKLIEPRI